MALHRNPAGALCNCVNDSRTASELSQKPRGKRYLSRPWCIGSVELSWQKSCWGSSSARPTRLGLETVHVCCTDYKYNGTSHRPPTAQSEAIRVLFWFVISRSVRGTFLTTHPLTPRCFTGAALSERSGKLDHFKTAVWRVTYSAHAMALRRSRTGAVDNWAERKDSGYNH